MKAVLAAARRRRHLHQRVALLVVAARDAAVRHDLSRAPALLLAHQPEVPARGARPGGHPRQAHPHARRLDPRLRRAQGKASGRRERGARSSRRERASSFRRRLAQFRRAWSCPSWRSLRCSKRSRPPATMSTASERRRAPARSSTTSASTTASLDCVARDQGLVQDRQVHSRNADPGRRRSALSRTSRSTRCCFRGTSPTS